MIQFGEKKKKKNGAQGEGGRGGFVGLGWVGALYSLMMSSDTFQSSKEPSGNVLLTIRGIFFAANSFIAICSGSVSPSIGTKTGAFMLDLMQTHTSVRCCFLTKKGRLGGGGEGEGGELTLFATL